MKDPATNISYAICMDDACGKLTCTTCKALLDSVEGHTCEQNEDYKSSRKQLPRRVSKNAQPALLQSSSRKPVTTFSTFKPPSLRAQTLTTSRCHCGAEFCYICGESWPGMHGCPHYGPAIYDEEGYNQDGFHRDTGINREGHTRRQALRDANSDDEDEDEDDDPDARHFVLQHVDAAMRATFNALPHQDREAFLLNLQIQLFEERGTTFNLPGDDESDDDGNEDEEDDADENINYLDGDSHPGDLHDRGEHDDSDSDTNTDTGNEDQNTDGQTDGAGDIATAGNVNDALNRLDGVLTNLEESLDAIVHETDAFINDESSSAASPATDRPATPMDVDSAEQGTKQKREPSSGTPGAWPVDEEL